MFWTWPAIFETWVTHNFSGSPSVKQCKIVANHNYLTYSSTFIKGWTIWNLRKDEPFGIGIEFFLVTCQCACTVFFCPFNFLVICMKCFGPGMFVEHLFSKITHPFSQKSNGPPIPLKYFSLVPKLNQLLHTSNRPCVSEHVNSGNQILTEILIKLFC